MASTNHILLVAAVLLSVHAATASFNCEPGRSTVPLNPLPSCRDYVIQQSCHGGRSAALSMERCCRELADIAAYCRCEALRIFMDGAVTSSGVAVGHVLTELPGCPRKAQRDIAKILVSPAVCNLGTIHGGPFCLAITDDPLRRHMRS